MFKKAIALIIKDDQVLMVEGINHNGQPGYFFMSGDVKESAEAWDELKVDLKNQINVSFNKATKVTSNLTNGLSLYLVNLDEEISLEYDIERIKCFREDYRPLEVKWVSLNSLRYFNEFNTRCLKEAFMEAIKANHQDKWMEIIKTNFYSGLLGTEQLRKIHKEKERKEVDDRITIKNKVITMIACLGLGFIFNYFFIWKSIGISGFIFTVAIVLTAIATFDGYKNYKNKRLTLLFLIPMVLLSISFSIYNDFVLRSLNIILIPFLIVGYLLIVRYESITDININFITSIFDRGFGQALINFPKFFVFGREAIKTRKGYTRSPLQKSILTGVLISIPLLVVVLVLLSSADMMFNYYLKNIGRIFEGFDSADLVGDFLAIGIFTLYIFGFMWSFKYNQVHIDRCDARNIKALWEPVTIITILFIINIAYLMFTAVQFSYLYAGGGLPEGYSYAEYARKGFFELILVTLINLTILLLATNFTKSTTTKVNGIINSSFSLLIVFTFNMLVSANYKMYMYEKAYGFTRLRIYVRVFMLLIGIVLFIVLLGIWLKRIPVFRYALIAAVVIYIGLNYINVDRIIARENIKRYHETHNLDLHYISVLSYDALPEVIKLLEVEDEYIRIQAKNILIDKKEELMNSYSHWFQYNYYRSQLLKLDIKE